MRKVFIPKGETVSYEALETEHLVVEGCLKVTNGVKARTISGDGVISAASVEADTIRINSLESGTVICRRLIAKIVQAPEVFASESAAVSCFISAAYVETGRLTAAISEIDEVKAGEVIHLPQKKRTLFGTLLASCLRSFWLSLTVPASRGTSAGAEESTSTEVTKEKESSEPAEMANDAGMDDGKKNDEELNRFVTLFQLLRDSGYTLRVIPGTPEENAPQFDFDSGTIFRNAA